MKPKDIKRLQRRSRALIVRRVSRGVYVVSSRSSPNLQHIVTVESLPEAAISARCTCPWAQNGGYGCSHVLATLHYIANRQKRTISFWGDLDDAQRQKHRILRLISANDEPIYITSRPARLLET